MKKMLRISLALLLTVLLLPFSSCKKDEPDPDVIASFTFVVDAADYKKVTFTNESTNFSALSWNFGDNTAVSTETNPVHTYAALGEYTVTLTATSPQGTKTDLYTTKVTIADPNAMLTMLVGETSKTWKLIRDVSTKRYPLEVGPIVNPTIWWAFGLQEDLAVRPCMLNDEWEFTRDGKMNFDAKGDYWAEGGIFEPANTCANSSQMVNAAGDDLSAWGNGAHTFELTPGTTSSLKVIGLGAYIGLCKVATDSEVTTPQESVTYNIEKLYDGEVDTLIIQTLYTTGDGQSAYWKFVLVHYDDPNAEPPIPANQPIPGFTMAVDGNTIVCTNTSQYADSYSWDFGDGSTSTEESPTHTYTNDGFYNVVLTATNSVASNTSTLPLFLSLNTPELTNELLQGGAWHVVQGEKTIFVGGGEPGTDGMGLSNWWSVPLSSLETGGDWSCIIDDEFTFTAGGVYTYDTKGSSRNDGYFGGTNGCITDAEIAASGENGAKFGSALAADAHTYTFTPATAESRAIIELTNSATRAAFIGFMKGYYGGENSDGANLPNGGSATNRYEVMGYAQGNGTEYLFVTVDISPEKTGYKSWSAILKR